jgi:regulator of sirC expression with transglutaminase-like and TPR domain
VIMVRHAVYLFVLLMILLVPGLTSCKAVESITGLDLPESPAYEIEEIVKSGDYEERLEIESYPINNCKCQTETSLTVLRERSLEESVEQSTGIEGGAGISVLSFAEFSLAVGREYGVGHAASITDGGSLEIKADPGTYPVYTIAWREKWDTGYVVVKYKGEEERIYYRFMKSARPEVVNVDYYDCEEAVPGVKSWMTYYEQGEAAYANGDFEAVIDKMSRVIEDAPEKVAAYIYRGLAYYNHSLYNQAIKDYSEVIRLDAGNVLAYYYRGLARYKQGLCSEAIVDYTKSIELEAGYAYSYNDRGNAYLFNKQYDLAIADYSRAIEIDAGYTYAYRNRGVAYYEKGVYRKAIADANKAIELDPEYANAYYDRALVYKVLGNKAAAIADFEKYITLSNSPEWREKARQEIEGLREQG